MPKNDIEEERSLEEISRIYIQAVVTPRHSLDKDFFLLLFLGKQCLCFGLLALFRGNKGFVFSRLKFCLDKEVICTRPLLPPTWDFATQRTTLVQASEFVPRTRQPQADILTSKKPKIYQPSPQDGSYGDVQFPCSGFRITEANFFFQYAELPRE